MLWIAIGVLLAALLGFVTVAIVVGSRLPRGHVATVRARYEQESETIWAAITRLTDAPNWRSGLRRVERLADRDGHPVWVEVSRNGKMRLAFEHADAPRRLVTRIDDDALPFGGTWTYVLEPDGTFTTLTITEDGTIRPAFFRFMARYVFGHDTTMKRYLRDLGKKFGETVQPERVL